ncbi:MAG: ABC transporter ATP-binding protein [Planctomycetota bacterium]|nr:ABC transporter ATP-binding protein [Planctomycetota bacterium]
MNDLAISVRGLKKSFGSKEVLKDVSFDIKMGETFALLGRNGSGKTTTIRILLGLMKADGGVIRVAGLDQKTSSIELRRQVGYLAEDQTMYGWMTPREICRFLKPFYPAWDDKLAKTLLDGFELPSHTRIEHLSKGQAVKLGLVVALAHQPIVAIFDDPVLGLDPISRKQFSRDLVEHLQSLGRAVLYSSHLLDEVEVVADTVAILDGGRIIRNTATDAIRQQVKQVALSLEDASHLAKPPGLLDVRTVGQQVIATIDHATQFLEQLAHASVYHDVVELSLDEISEAFVIGRSDAWPRSGIEFAKSTIH